VGFPPALKPWGPLLSGRWKIDSAAPFATLFGRAVVGSTALFPGVLRGRKQKSYKAGRLDAMASFIVISPDPSRVLPAPHLCDLRINFSLSLD
jgi:hypothetical protein